MGVTRKNALSAGLAAVLDGLLIIVLLVVAAEVIIALVLVANPANPMRRFFEVTTMATVPSGVWPTAQLVGIADHHTTASVEPWAYIAFRANSRGFVLITLVASLAVWACYLIVLLELRGVCATVSAGTPFPRDNIRRMRVMGWAIIGTAVVDLLIDAAVIAYMTARVTVNGSPARVPGALLLAEFPLPTIIAGLAVLVLAGIFRIGADLETDQRLTI